MSEQTSSGLASTSVDDQGIERYACAICSASFV